MKTNNSKLGMALALLGFFLWCLSFYGAQRVGGLTSSFPVRWFNGGVSPWALTRQESFFKEDGMQNIPTATLWEETPAQNITDNGYNKTSVSVVELFGDAADIGRGETIKGSFPVKGDTLGCVISEKTAFDLWGNSDVLGMTVVWNGKIYAVNGVIRSNEGLLMVQTEGDSIRLFPYMQLSFDKEGKEDKNVSLETANAYLNKAGFYGAEILDLPLLGQLVNAVCYLPALLLTLGVLIQFVQSFDKLLLNPFSGSSNDKNVKRLLAYLHFPLLLAVTCVVLLAITIKIPAYLIPPQWSNFEFYPALLSDLITQSQAWLLHPTGRDIIVLFWLLEAFLSLTIAAGLIFSATGRLQFQSPLACMVGCLCCLGVMLASVWLFAAQNGVHIPAIAWLSPCLWIFGRRIAHDADA